MKKKNEGCSDCIREVSGCALEKGGREENERLTKNILQGQDGLM